MSFIQPPIRAFIIYFLNTFRGGRTVFSKLELQLEVTQTRVHILLCSVQVVRPRSSGEPRDGSSPIPTYFLSLSHG